MLSSEESSAASNGIRVQFQSLYRALRLLLGVVNDGVRSDDFKVDPAKDDETASASIVKDFSEDIPANDESAIKNTVVEKNIADDEKPNALADVIYLIQVCANLFKDDSLDVVDAQFLDSLAVLVLLWTVEYVENVESAKLSLILESLPVLLDYLLKVLNQKVGKLRRPKSGTDSASSSKPSDRETDHSLLPCEVIILVLEAMTKENSAESKPEVVNAWEDLLDSRGCEIKETNCVLLRTLKQYKDKTDVIETLDKTEQEVSEDVWNPKMAVSRIHELLHCNGFAKDSNLLPKLKDIYREILRNQKVPEAVLDEVEFKWTLKDGESKDTILISENFFQKWKIRLKHRMKSLSTAPEHFDFEPFAMFSEKCSSNFMHTNLTYLLNKDFPRLILSFYNAKSCFDKFDMSFKQLVPSETSGIFNSLVFDWSKAKENVENLRKILDLIKFVKTAVNLTTRSSPHCLVLSEDLIRAVVECIAASLVFVLSEIIATAASSKRESFREDNSSVVQELIPSIVDLIRSVSSDINHQNTSLQHLATAMIGWLHLSFLHGLSKSQYSMTTERQSSGRSARRNYSRSYSFRSGSPGILTNAILSIVEQSYEALSKITQFAPMYVDGKNAPFVSDNRCAPFINAIFTQINTTSLSLWLLNVLLKKAISLNPLKSAQGTKPTSSEKNNLESEFLEEVEFHPYLSQLNRREIKICKTTFAVGESNNSAHTTVSGQASSETLNAAPATSSGEVQADDANAENSESSNLAENEANGASSEQDQARMYNALPMDSETDNSSTTGGNSLFEEAMLDEDADDDDYTEEDEEDEDEDEDHDQDDQDEEDVEEEEMVIEAQEGEDDVEWIDHAAIIELINETEGATQNSGMVDGSLAAAAGQQQVDDLIVMGTTFMQQNSDIAEQTNESAEEQNEDQDEEDSFLATLEGSGNEAILKLLFQDENTSCGDVATKEQTEEATVDENGVAEWQKMTTYLRSCRLIVKLLLDNAFTPDSMLNRNMKEYFSSNQSSTLASILRELESLQLDVYSGLTIPHSLKMFKKLIYQLVHAFISSEFCDTLEKQCSFLRDLGFKWDSDETASSWPLTVPLPWLSLLAQVILFAQENSSIITQIWKKLIGTLVAKIKHSSPATLTSQVSKNETDKDVASTCGNLFSSTQDLSPYQLQLLQFTFYELNTAEKTQLVKCICESIFEISDCSEEQFSANQLYISRLCLILEFMLNHFSNAPANLAEQVEGNMFGSSTSKIATDSCVSVFLEGGILNNRMNSKSPNSEGMELENLQKYFYDINGASNAANIPASGAPLRLPRICKEGLKALMSCDVDYNEFYGSVLNLIKIPTAEKDADFMQCLASAYLFGIVLRVCSLLPPSIQFMTGLSNPVSQESLKSNLVYPMIQVMWTARLSSEYYAPFVSHALEQNHPESKDVVATFKDGKLLLNKMLQILQQGLALLDCSNEKSKLPNSEKLLLIDMTASRLHCELEAQSEKSSFDLEMIATAIPLIDKLLDKVYELSRTYIIEKLKKLKASTSVDSSEVYACIIQSDFQVSPFKAILKTCNFFEKNSNNCEDFVELLHKNGESHLKEAILQWKAASGLSTIWDMKNGQANFTNFKNYPIPSEMRGMHVLSAHIRCLMIEGEKVLLSLQHTMMSSLNLFRDLIGWAPAECLTDDVITAMCSRCLSILNHETCDAKENLAKSLDDFSEKVFKKASDRCPTGHAIASLRMNKKQTPSIPAIVLKRVLCVFHDLARFSSPSDASYSVPLMNQCLQQLETALFSSNLLVSAATIEMFSSSERQLFDTLSLLSNQNLQSETINILLNFLYRIANEMLSQKSATESTEQVSTDVQLSPSVAVLLSKAQLGSILETLFTKQLDYTKNVAFYDDKETFILMQNMSKLLVDRANSVLPQNFVSSLLIRLIESARSIVRSRKQPEKYEKLMNLMLILANHNNGSGHVALFKASLEFVSLCTNNATEILQSIESVLNDCENGEWTFPSADGTNPSETTGQVQMFNVIFIYVAEMFLQLTNKRVDDEDFSMNGAANFLVQFESGVATDSGDSRDMNSQLSAEMTSDCDLEISRAGMVKKANSGENVGAVASGESAGPKLCTYTVTQKEFMNQHWYHCYSCSMHDSVGVCSVCAKLCHKRHDVTYAKFGSFYCDCGARGERYCKALSKASIEKHLKESQNSRHLESLTFESGLDKFSVDSGAPTKDDIVKGLLNDAAMLSQKPKLRGGKSKSCAKEISDVFKPQLLQIAMNSDLHNVVQLMLNLRTCIQKHLYNTSPSNSSKRLEKCFRKLHDAELKTVNIVTNLVSLTARSVESTFENVKMTFSGEHGATMRQLITAHMIRRTAMCLVPPKLGSPNPSGAQNNFPILIVAHDKGLLTCVDTANLLRQSESVNGKKLNIDRLATSTVPMTILSICSNSSYPEYLAVTGIKDCHVLVYNSADCSISSQVSLNLSLDAGNFIIKALWIPGSQTQLAIITADFIKIYDLAYDLQNPIYFYHLLSGKLRDVTFLIDGATNTVNLLIMSSQGFIYTQVLDDQSRAENGPFYVTNNIVLESSELKMSNGQFGSGGLSIYYSHTMQMLFFSFSNAKSFACSLKKLEELPTSTVLNKIQLLTNTSALCHWKEIEGHAGVILASDEKSGTVSFTCMCPDSFQMQEVSLSPARCKTLDVVGVRTSSENGRKSTSIMILADDGGLKVFTVNSAEKTASFWISSRFNPSIDDFAAASYRKKMKPATLKIKQQVASASVTGVEFPIDYFENCQALDDVEFGGNDYLQVYNRKQMKNRLKYANQYLAASKSTPIIMDITNENSSMLISGLRVQVGCTQSSATSPDRAPTFLEIFGRQVQLEPLNSSRWVDLPFTTEECLLSEKSVSLTIGNSRDPSGITIVDSVKVYGKPKNNFVSASSDANEAASSGRVGDGKSGLVALKGDEFGDLFGLRILDGDSESYATQSFETAFDLFISNCLEVLSLHFNMSDIDPKARSAKEAKELASYLTSCPLPVSISIQNKNLLFSIFKSKEKLYMHVDEISLNCVARALQSENLSPETFERHLQMIKHIAQNRPRNLIKFSAQMVVNRDCADEHDGEKISNLVEDVMSKFWSVVEDRCNVKLLVPLVNQTRVKNEILVGAVVEILFTFGIQDSDLMPHMMTHLVSLLLYHDPTISFVAKSALNRLTRPHKQTNQMIPSRNIPIKPPAAAGSNEAPKENPEPQRNEPQRRRTEAAPEQSPAPSGSIAASVRANATLRDHLLQNLTPPNPGTIDNQNEPPPVPHSELDALLNVAPLLEIPNDADDEAMMELAIALSLQDQPETSNNPTPAIAGTVIFEPHAPENPGNEAESINLSTAAVGGLGEPSISNLSIEPHVEFVETPDVSNLQGDSTDETGSAVGTDEEEESLAATDGSALPVENMSAQAAGSGAASEDGNSLAGESIQTTASASSSAYGGEEPVNSQCLNAGAKNPANVTTTLLGSTETMNLNTSFVMEENSTCKLADSRTEMLKLMMNYLPQVCNVGGIRAVPFLQVFLSLSLEIENEQVIALVLEKVISQLKLKVDPTIFSRNFSKEVQVLLLRLLSMYMQKTSKADEVSALARMTANALNDKSIIEFCRLVVSEMLPYWRNSFVHVELERSMKLLRAQPVQSPPDMHPFFLASYVIGHQADVFEAYHQLLTEVTLRIPYQAYRLLEIEVHPDIKKEWVNCLSQYMILPSQYVRHQVRKLLQFICGTKEAYRLQRDLYVFRHHFDAIQTIFDNYQKTLKKQSSPVRSSKTAKNENVFSDCNIDCGVDKLELCIRSNFVSLDYSALITVVEHLKQVLETAVGRCFSWFTFCETRPSVVAFLMKLASITTEAIYPYILELIILATCGSKATVVIKNNSGAVERPKKQIVLNANKSTEKSTNGEEDTSSSPECTEETCKEFADELVATYIPLQDWKLFLSTFFLECSSPSLRWQIHGLIRSLWKSISAESQFKLVEVLWDIWSEAANFGKRASQLVDILGFVTLKSNIEPTNLQIFCEKLVALLQEQNERLQNHPNFFLYEKLLHVVEFDGFYLENDPCIVCHSKENTSVLTKLSSIKADSRFTTTTQIIKLTSPYQINSIVCRITDINNSKMVKSMAIYYNKRTVASVVELKNNPQVWHRARKVTLEAGQSEVKIEFTLPVVATNLMMEVCDFYENFHATSESLQCPRCSSSVMANPGICGNCGENVFQCHKCRQINYDEKDPFLCSSCGFCKYAKFDFTLNAKPCLAAVDPIENQDDRKRAISALNGLLETADSLTKSVQSQHPYLEDLFHRLDAGECVTNIYCLGSPEMRNINLHASGMSITSSVGHGSSTLIHKVIQNVAMKYYECKMSFEELSIVSDKIIATRGELFDYDRKNNLITVYSDAFCCSDKQHRESDGDDNGLEFGQLRKKADLQASTKRCFGCLVHSAIHSIYLLKAFATSPAVKPLISSTILNTLLIGPNMRNVCGKVQSLANGLIMTVCRNDEANTKFFCQTLMKSIKDVARSSSSINSPPQFVSTKGLHDQVSLLVSYIDLKDSCWNIRLQAVTQLLLFGVQCNNAPIISHIVLPCMKSVLNLIQTPSNPSENVKRKESHVDINDWFLGKEMFETWVKSGAAKTDKQKQAGRELSSNSWIRAALFHPGSKIVRQVACQILESLACHDEKRCEIVLMLIMQFIEDSCCSTQSNQDLADLMSLVQKLACKDDRKVILSSYGVPKRIAELILSEIGHFTDKEKEHGPLASKGRNSNRGATGGVSASWSHDLCQGVRLRCLSELLSGLLEVNEILNHWKAQLIQPILHGYLAAKKLVSQRTKAIDEAQDILLEMLDLMTTGTVEETAEFMKICVLTLQQFPTDDQLTPVFVFERLCNLIHPEQADTSPEFALCLEKDPQQEDFLSGRMQGNPYNSSEPGMGPLMRDVKNKICRDCELVALLEDDNGMELLVNNKIISLSLPVAEVYQKVWLATERGGDPQNEGEPMRVVYRMRGLMGDATEEFIENLNARSASGTESNGDENSSMEEEEKYKLAAVLAECNGFHVMLNSLNSISDVFASKHLMYVLLKLFSYCVKLRSNRIALVSREYDTLKVFLKLLQLVLNMPETAASASSSAVASTFRPTNNEASATRNELVEKVLMVMQPILQETQNIRSLEISGNLEQLDQILSCMNISHVQQNPLLLHNLMTIVPYLSFGDNSQTKMIRIIEFFKPFIDFEKYNEDKLTSPEVAVKTELFIDCFIAMVESIPASDDGCQLKSLISKCGILSNCTNYVLNLTPGKEYLADQKAWKEYLARPAVPYVLKMMRALSKSHEENQIVLSKGCIPVLHRLERVASEEQVGTLAENLLETLKENMKVSEIITGARKQTREEKKRLAMAMRAKQLETLGLEATSGGRVVKTSSSHNVNKFEDLAEETGPICCICREGYKYHPKSVMGIYVFAKKHVIEQFEQAVRVESAQRSGDGGVPSISVVPRGPITAKAQGYSTVTSFNTVHYDCHNNAVRSHRGRDEWESATLQNADVKCNGILPMWGAQVSESHFANSLARYNAHLQESTGLREPTYNTTVHDCKLLLLKFAEEKSFSEDCGGGARQSNAKLIPYMLNIALYVLNSTRNAPREELLVNQFIQDPVDKWVRNSFETEGAHFYALMQLLVMNPKTFWVENSIHFLRRLLVCVHVRSSIQQPLHNNPATVQITEKEYKVYKPALLYFTLINSLSKALEKVPSKPGRPWSEEVMEYLKMNDASVLEGLEKNFLGTFEEALAAECFAEWCDIVGLLPKIGPENVEQFMTKTIQKINPEVNL